MNILIKLELFLLKFRILKFLGCKLRHYLIYKRYEVCRTLYSFSKSYIDMCLAKERESRERILIKYARK